MSQVINSSNVLSLGVFNTFINSRLFPVSRVRSAVTKRSFFSDSVNVPSSTKGERIALFASSQIMSLSSSFFSLSAFKPTIFPNSWVCIFLTSFPMISFSLSGLSNCRISLIVSDESFLSEI